MSSLVILVLLFGLASFLYGYSGGVKEAKKDKTQQ